MLTFISYGIKFRNCVDFICHTLEQVRAHSGKTKPGTLVCSLKHIECLFCFCLFFVANLSPNMSNLILSLRNIFYYPSSSI